MANSSRLNKNRNGQMLIPMNVDGGVFEDGFFTSAKVCTLIGILLYTGGMILWATELYLSFLGNLIIALCIILVDQCLLRYIVFEEKYFYRMYKKMKDCKITTPAVFWNIVSMKETEDGTIMCYGDGKIGVLIKVDRDTIIGRDESFKETHYDAISDFYKELNLKELKFVQMNLMEQAGKDPRLNKLGELVRKPSNKNISKIVEMQIGYIKKITRATLFESDYYLIYSENMNDTNRIINDSIDCIYKLMDGAYLSYTICDRASILEILKEQYGIKYFDYTEAIATMYKNVGANISKTYDIVSIKYTDGTEDSVDKVGNNRLIELTSYVNNGTLKFGDWTTKEALKGNFKKNKKVENKFKGTKLNEIIEDSEDTDDIDLDNENFGEDIESDIEHNKNKNFENYFENNEIHSEMQYSENLNSSKEINQQNKNVEDKKAEMYLEDDEVIDLS